MAIPPQVAMAAAGVAAEALPLLMREIFMRKQLKRQRDEHRQLEAEVEAGQFGPGAATMQRRTAANNEALRQQMDMQRQAQQRGVALGGSPADMQRMEQASARAQAQAALQGRQQLVEQARQERELDEMSKRQQLADMDARREAFTMETIQNMMGAATQGAGIGGKKAALKGMGMDQNLSGFDPSMLTKFIEMERARLAAMGGGQLNTGGVGSFSAAGAPSLSAGMGYKG